MQTKMHISPTANIYPTISDVINYLREHWTRCG